MEQQTKNREWKTVRLDSIFDIQQGKQVSESNRVGANQRPFLRTANVFWGKLSLKNLDHMNFTEAEETRYALRDGDILVCEGGDVGRSTIWHNEIENCYHQNHLHRLRKINNNTDENFVLRWLQYQIVDNKILTGRANSTTIPNLSKSRLSELEITLPGVSEQKAISNVLTTTQGAIAGQEELIEKLKKLKKTMMQHLFTHGTKNEPTKMSEIGEIPESWKVLPLKDLVPDIDYGVSQAIPKTSPENGYKIVSTADITKEGRLLYNQLRYIAVTDNQSEKLRLKNGDVLFNWRNSLDHIGKSAIYDHFDEHVIFASFVLRLRCDEKKAHNRFVRDLMNYYRENEVFSRLARRAVNQANYNRNEIYVLKIPAPSYNEQVEIAKAVQGVDHKIESAQIKLFAYQKLFKTLLHELMGGKRYIKE